MAQDVAEEAAVMRVAFKAERKSPLQAVAGVRSCQRTGGRRIGTAMGAGRPVGWRSVNLRRPWLSPVAPRRSGREFFQCCGTASRWAGASRFRFLYTRGPKRRKGPRQLNIFAADEYAYPFTVIVSNATLFVRKLLVLHDSRGAQEGIFVQLKPQTRMDSIPCRCRAANET